uniref:Uncharacterized protein n=1 Tax=Anguilla anguilla TaxID=7936 RepID=A0A0E9URX8_ANGAN
MYFTAWARSMVSFCIYFLFFRTIYCMLL